MLEIRSLAFSYGSHEVLKDISFTAEKGELLCILGPNGAGKSTLFKCILGLLKGYSGSVTVDGKAVAELNSKERARQLAYIPQATKPAFAYTVLEMVTMGLNVQLDGFRSPGEKERNIAREALATMGVAHLSDRNYTMLSGGEQQLVLIARAIAQGAKILVMDEPTSSLDYGNQMRVQRSLKKLAEDGYTIIQSTHNPEQTYLFADRIVCIKDGCVYSQGKPAEVLTEQMIKDLYGIEVTMIKAPDDRARFFELKEE